MGIRLDEAEIRVFLEEGHTGILTTLRRDGFPVTLPTWYAADAGRIYLNTPAKAKKIARIRNDPRASFLVESGLTWAELKAVMLYGRLHEVEDGTLRARIDELLDEKYRAFRTQRASQPEATRRHYAKGVMLCFVPQGEPVTWDNAKLRMG